MSQILHNVRNMQVNSFCGGEQRGMMVQFTLAADFAQLSRSEVVELVAVLTTWLGQAKDQTDQTFNFGDGPVPAAQHTNPDGSVGGWVAATASVAATAWVSDNAQVYGDARVYGAARVSGTARVYGTAQVSGDARVYGIAQVYDAARVYGTARVFGDARVLEGDLT